MVKLKLYSIKRWLGCREKDTLILWKHSARIHWNWKYTLHTEGIHFDGAISLPGISLIEKPVHVHQKTWQGCSIACNIQKKGGAGNPNTDHYIYHMNKEWYIHMMEYYTVMKIEIICIYPEKEKGGAREEWSYSSIQFIWKSPKSWFFLYYLGTWCPVHHLNQTLQNRRQKIEVFQDICLLRKQK